MTDIRQAILEFKHELENKLLSCRVLSVDEVMSELGNLCVAMQQDYTNLPEPLDTVYVDAKKRRNNPSEYGNVGFGLAQLIRATEEALVNCQTPQLQ